MATSARSRCRRQAPVNYVTDREDSGHRNGGRSVNLESSPLRRSAAGRSSMTDFVLDALEQAVHARRDVEGLIHHSDRGTQYLSIRYGERLAESGIEPSVGSTGDSYDNALAESINGLYKAEVIHRHGPWRNVEDVEFATLEWVDWFNNRRLLEPIGDIPPAQFEHMYYQQQQSLAIAA